jgi:methylmalonyl-CoA mutase N-terminal domain/subunit
LAFESGVSLPVDPLGGSYYVERLTDQIEERVHAELAEIDRLGGTLAAIAGGYQQGAIADAAYAAQRAIESGEQIVVGVNALVEGGDQQRPLAQAIDPAAEEQQRARTVAVRAGRDAARATERTRALEAAAAGTENVLPRIRACVEAQVTLGEISGALRRAWGEYRP